MSDTPSPAELITMMLAASRALDTAQDELLRCTREHASAERRYHLVKSTSYLSTSGTVGERDAQVTKITDLEAYEAKLADGLAKAALENVRSKRAQLSALQSVSAAVKAEAELLRVGGSYGP